MNSQSFPEQVRFAQQQQICVQDRNGITSFQEDDTKKQTTRNILHMINPAIFLQRSLCFEFHYKSSMCSWVGSSEGGYLCSIDLMAKRLDRVVCAHRTRFHKIRLDVASQGPSRLQGHEGKSLIEAQRTPQTLVEHTRGKKKGNKQKRTHNSTSIWCHVWTNFKNNSPVVVVDIN